MLAEEFGWRLASFTVPADWHCADNECDFAIAYVIGVYRRCLKQAERGECRCCEADVLPLLRCQMRTFQLSKYALRGTDDLVAAWQEIQARAALQVSSGAASEAAWSRDAMSGAALQRRSGSAANNIEYVGPHAAPLAG